MIEVAAAYLWANGMVMVFDASEAARWVRELITVDELREVARRVREDRCQCCGVDDDEPAMQCGHRRCYLCSDRDHICLACAVAT